MAEELIEAPQVIQALALGIDTAWRRRSPEERCRDVESLGAALRGGAVGAGSSGDIDSRGDVPPQNKAGDVRTFTYSMIGLQPNADLLLWSLGPSLEAIEERAAAVLRSGLGGWLTVEQSLLGLIQGSQYVKRPTPQEQSLFSGERARYLVVYPFTKSSDWYLLGREARQGVMNEHIRVGHQFPQVRQLLANSFGIDDQDFVVAYETDDLDAFSKLVRELRGTESRRSTVRDTPILTGVRRDLGEIAALLGAAS